MDVPVLITNFVDKSGNKPNTQSTLSDSWRFVRRFMIYDTISGIDQVGGFQNRSVPAVIRYASSIKVKISLDPNFNEQIYTPYLIVTYTEKETNLIHSSFLQSVSLVMDYFQDLTKFWTRILIAFCIFQAFIAGIVATRIVYFVRQNPPALLKQKFPKVLVL